jgi:hypothetical protein
MARAVDFVVPLKIYAVVPLLDQRFPQLLYLSFETRRQAGSLLEC